MAAKKKTEVVEKAVKKPSRKPSSPQVSLAIPSTIISRTNAANLEHVTHIAYQVAKAAATFNVSEIVIIDVPNEKEESYDSSVVLKGDKGGTKLKFDDDEETKKMDSKVASNENVNNEPQLKDMRTFDNGVLFATLLQFFVTPPYLVQTVFAKNQYKNKFGVAKKLPKISMLPFMSNNEVYRSFKEGLTIAKRTPQTLNKRKKVKGSKLSVTKYVNIGEKEPLELVGQDVPVNVRVTVDIANKKVVSPLEAYGFQGCKGTFGYQVRHARLLSAVFTGSGFEDGYTCSLHVLCQDYFGNSVVSTELKPPSNSKDRVLLVFSNDRELEALKKADSQLSSIDSVSQLFDGRINVPTAARVEDAVFIALTRCLGN
ncbi:uncharacterized protein KQ657_001018 [Scheffersomyces spartinae]|uniref:Methyltransferase n=1 Tax=Scheffersomyces spartinae TaxID=45513 RepID=A0A9P7V898_9ASCO|nr:uncharacterized protein KQ657_001018 [Scheffersomyces spartinae]KAG7193255.1 hypothetical protein KQ657_001018 [Scheffersomyces spartinae]